ncbi:hypothetical protein LCGC14_2613120 [marine sediment metagenome]|uniref:Uncharacterized protein n=1 Tax=marine sediment metagenome TaxID=412755 RepID=A0A0F9AT00_9ZZZZ
MTSTTSTYDMALFIKIELERQFRLTWIKAPRKGTSRNTFGDHRVRAR